jgi:hypothetical protein
LFFIVGEFGVKNSKNGQKKIIGKISVEKVNKKGGGGGPPFFGVKNGSGTTELWKCVEGWAGVKRPRPPGRPSPDFRGVDGPIGREVTAGHPILQVNSKCISAYFHLLTTIVRQMGELIGKLCAGKFVERYKLWPGLAEGC